MDLFFFSRTYQPFSQFIQNIQSLKGTIQEQSDSDFNKPFFLQISQNIFSDRFGYPDLKAVDKLDVQIFNFSKIVTRQTTVNRGR